MNVGGVTPFDDPNDPTPRWIVPYTPLSILTYAERQQLNSLNLVEEWAFEYVLAKYAFMHHCWRNNRMDWMEGEMAGDMGDFFFPPTDDEGAYPTPDQMSNSVMLMLQIVWAIFHRLQPFFQDVDQYLPPGYFSHFVYRPFDAESALIAIERLGAD